MGIKIIIDLTTRFGSICSFTVKPDDTLDVAYTEEFKVFNTHNEASMFVDTLAEDLRCSGDVYVGMSARAIVV